MNNGQTPHATTSAPPTPAARTQPTNEGPSFHPESIQVLAPSSGDSGGAETERDTRPQSSSTERRLLISALEGHTRSQENPLADFERVPLPFSPHSRSREGLVRASSNRAGLAPNGGHSAHPRNGSGLDWIVPMDEKVPMRQTVGHRLKPTIENALKERDKYAQKALWTGYALNIAIGLQVFLGALTTGLAAALPIGRQAQVSTSVLGGLSTLVASYLARARGSGEPELSITRVKDLEQFLRECKAFELDHSHEYGNTENRLDDRLADLRRRFEELLGNANGERKLSPVGITMT